jgi:hypothetical protein
VRAQIPTNELSFVLVRATNTEPTANELTAPFPIEWHRQVPPASMGNYYRSLDVLMVTSGPEEGFFLPAVEAMACGVPTVLTDVPLNAEVFNNEPFGPVAAIPKALAHAGISIGDVDLFEINEAFAAQAVYCVDTLGIDRSRLNVNGGAIALGHPLGCTGAKLTATLLSELARRNGRYGVVSMCIGGGMGAAAVFERV